jgi:hypothetical protein
MLSSSSSSSIVIKKKRKNELFCFKHMTDEEVYTMRINRIKKKKKENKGQSIRSKPFCL